MGSKRLSPPPVRLPWLRVGCPKVIFSSAFPGCRFCRGPMDFCSFQELLGRKPKWYCCERLWAQVSELVANVSASYSWDQKRLRVKRQSNCSVSYNCILPELALKSCCSTDIRTLSSNGWVWFQLTFNLRAQAFSQHQDLSFWKSSIAGNKKERGGDSALPEVYG